MRHYKSDILFITALEEEFKELQTALNQFDCEPIKELRNGDLIYQTELSGFKIYLACAYESGMVSTGILASMLIDKLVPKYLIMTGICAGFEKKKVKKGDVLIASSVINYEKGKLSIDGFTADHDTLNLDDELKKLFKANKNDLIASTLQRQQIPGRTPKAKVKPILTGDKVVAEQDYMKYLDNSFARKAKGVEMEGYGLFLSANLSKHPKPKPILIKSVCDFGTRDKDDKFHIIASRLSALFCLNFILKCLKPEKKLSPVNAVETIQMEDQGSRGKKRLIEAIERSTKGHTIKIISITGSTLLITGRHQGDSLQTALEQALKKGVNCQAILLKTGGKDCKEAKIRSEFESPKKKTIASRMLFKDSSRVREATKDWEKYIKNGQMKICYSGIGLSMGLYLFEDCARTEPYHFGKKRENRNKNESALCGFSQLWIQRTAQEYEILENHFDNLWKKLSQ